MLSGQSTPTAVLHPSSSTSALPRSNNITPYSQILSDKIQPLRSDSPPDQQQAPAPAGPAVTLQQHRYMYMYRLVNALWIVYCICSNTRPGLPSWLWRPSLYSGPAFIRICQYQQPNLQEKDRTNLTTGSFFGLFSYPHSSETLKMQIATYTMRKHSLQTTVFELMGDWPHPFVMLGIHRLPCP